MDDDVRVCLVKIISNFKGLMTLIIFWTGWAVFRDSQWILAPGLKGYLLMLAVGLFLAVVVELVALHWTGAWRYKEQMIVIPILGVGLLPILQMLLHPPATAVLVQWRWRKRREKSYPWPKSLV